MTEHADISAVSETLFLPLYSLALESQRPNPIIVDDEAVALTRRLNEYFTDSDRPLFRRLAQGRQQAGCRGVPRKAQGRRFQYHPDSVNQGVSAAGELKKGDQKTIGLSISQQDNGHVDYTINVLAGAQ